MNKNNRGLRTALIFLLLLAGLVVWLKVDFVLARFQDEVSHDVTTVSSGESGHKLGGTWYIYAEGPSFFKKTVAALLSPALLEAPGQPIELSFLDAFPEGETDGPFLYAKFSGRCLWASSFAKYEDEMEYSFTSNGDTRWIKEKVWAPGESPAFGVQGTSRNKGWGVGVLSLRGCRSHRVSSLLSKLTESIEKGLDQMSG